MKLLRGGLILHVCIQRGCLDTGPCTQREGDVAILTVGRQTKKKGLEYMLPHQLLEGIS